ncbi:hypothetical protein DPMN_011152 [Dreissena polymorpha]|uniref:Uncharacterized protein n=1 Tax=Dreissena polymorpha TaxID=45954 RepID=A0A9D4N329_DREPO|nr:hypothetical protein DPMN_011152 [Dreissena polymorpha]
MLTLKYASPFLSCSTDIRASSELVLTRVVFSLVPITSAGTRILAISMSKGAGERLTMYITNWPISCLMSLESCLMPCKSEPCCQRVTVQK